MFCRPAGNLQSADFAVWVSVLASGKVFLFCGFELRVRRLMFRPWCLHFEILSLRVVTFAFELWPGGFLNPISTVGFYP